MKQLLTFCAIGVANSLLGLAVIFALKWLAGMPDVGANFIGYAVGLAASFFLNKTLTFAHRGNYLGTAVKFGLVQLLAYGANLLTVLLLIRAGTNTYLAQAAGIVPYSAIGFLGGKYFAFRSIAAPSPGAGDSAGTARKAEMHI